MRRRAVKQLPGPQLGLGVDDGGPDRERLKKYNAWFTPQGAVLLIYRFLAHLVAVRCLRAPATILDPQAGGGVFGWGAHKQFPGARRVAVEVRDEELEHLRHNYDDVEIADYLAGPRGARKADALITNPSFEEALAVADAGLADLEPEGWMALLVRLTWGDNNDVAAWLREHPPVACLELDGRLEFAVGINPDSGDKYGQDSTTHRVLIWRDGGGHRLRGGQIIHGAIDYERYMKLPRMTDAERKWMRIAGQPVRPGTEYLHGL